MIKIVAVKNYQRLRKQEPWVISYSALDDEFDFEPFSHLLRSNLNSFSSGGATLYCAVAIVAKIGDCSPTIAKLRKMIPRNKIQFQNQGLTNNQMCIQKLKGLGKLEMMSVDKIYAYLYFPNS
tara:strand:+ start:352 stop:720 length:369 start_codon:yes stop_codon:yes gene_type:complete